MLARCPDAEDAALFSGVVLRLCDLLGGHDQAAPWGLWVTLLSLRSTPVQGGIGAQCRGSFNNDGGHCISLRRGSRARGGCPGPAPGRSGCPRSARAAASGLLLRSANANPVGPSSLADETRWTARSIGQPDQRQPVRDLAGARSGRLQRSAGRRVGHRLAGRWQAAARCVGRSPPRWADCPGCAGVPRCIAPQRRAAPAPRRSRRGPARRACARSGERPRQGRGGRERRRRRRAASRPAQTRPRGSSSDPQYGGTPYLSVAKCPSTGISRRTGWPGRCSWSSWPPSAR